MSGEEQPFYDVMYRPSAGRDLKRLKNNREVLISIRSTIDSLSKDPRPNTARMLSDGSYRIRDGEYRILYDVDDDTREVIINRVRDRKDVYRH